MKKNARFYAAERMGNLVYDAINQLIQIQNGIDALRRFLNVLQVIDEIDWRCLSSNLAVRELR